MTIRERFAKYSTQEIETGIARLEAKVAEYEADMEHYKEARDVEMFNVAKDLRDDYFNKLQDAECALLGRRQ